jgi:membrane protease YdiL (CAAX protease family)
VDRSAESPINHEPMTAPAGAVSSAADERVLSRYRPLQVASILLAITGVAGMLVGANLVPLAGTTLPTTDRAALALAVAAAGAIALVVGLVTNTVRAIVVRERLPATRYRGPSVIVLLLLATVVTLALASPYLVELERFRSGEPTSTLATLVILTSTQMGLVGTAILFIALPNALPGVHLLPSRGAVRSILIGLALSIPAWIGATLLSYLLTRVLELFGRSPEAGVVAQAVSTQDPTVLIVAVALVAPVAEEVFFRGVAFNAWLREYGPRRAYLGSAVLFATIHADTTSWDSLVATGVTVVPVILGLGLLLAVVYHRIGSLAAAISLHAGFNAISLTLALLARLLGVELPT